MKYNDNVIQITSNRVNWDEMIGRETKDIGGVES